MRLIAALVRHGKYEQPEGVPSAHLPYPLTPEGEAQARELASVLVEAAVTRKLMLHPVVDSSRMLRAFQTATLAARGLTEVTDRKVAVEEFDALAERGLGAAANLTLDAIEAIVRRDPRYGTLPARWKYESAFQLPFQGAENLIDAGKRVARHVDARLDAVADTEAGDTMKVFVGHGGAFRHAAVELGVMPLDRAPRLSMWHCQPILLERLEGGRWSHIGGAWKERSASSEAAD